MSVLAPSKPLTAATLGAELARGKFLVVGAEMRATADELVKREPFRCLRVRTDERRDPKAWEVY